MCSRNLGEKKTKTLFQLTGFFSLRNASHCTNTPAATGRFRRAPKLLSGPAALFPLKATVVLRFSEGRVAPRKSEKDLKAFLGWSP